ncbi:hypothetical protein EUGRSUZ_G02293 [Eucalyptus grandis]|uniref:Uncharacterized protein n=2 Tax=Eucalyptus grandis TaxID=71139 RepID=A0ACC3K5J8_EUCGR|nr:hypothetical protein EUGRSUZ_G02293 [Eucalyptus grandis]
MREFERLLLRGINRRVLPLLQGCGYSLPEHEHRNCPSDPLQWPPLFWHSTQLSQEVKFHCSLNPYFHFFL